MDFTSSSHKESFIGNFTESSSKSIRTKVFSSNEDIKSSQNIEVRKSMMDKVNTLDRDYEAQDAGPMDTSPFLENRSKNPFIPKLNLNGTAIIQQNVYNIHHNIPQYQEATSYYRLESVQELS